MRLNLRLCFSAQQVVLEYFEGNKKSLIMLSFGEGLQKVVPSLYDVRLNPVLLTLEKAKFRPP